MKIALIGYRATGKSTVGALLSQRLGVAQIDTDSAIESRAQKTVAAIFKEDGEPAFRDLEAQIVAELLDSHDPLVIATGGGVPLRESTRKLMKERAVVVWLTASVETIARRMLGDAGTASRRPSLTGAASPVDEIERVLSFREPIYRDAATLIVDTEGKTVAEIVDEIVARIPQDRA